NSTTVWRYEQTLNGPGGYIYGNHADGDRLFKFDCPVPNNSLVTVALGHAVGVNVMGCNLDVDDLSVLTWQTTTSGVNWPIQFIPQQAQPLISIPATGTHKLVCGYQSAGNGDASIVSYRTVPAQ